MSRQGYHAWLKREKEANKRQKERAKALYNHQMIFKQIIRKLGYVPGKRTFRLHMWRDYNIVISVKRARNIMKSMNLVAKKAKKDAYKQQATHKHVCSSKPNYVNQLFKQAPRTIILTDITYLYYGINRTPIYLCAFKDAYTAEILGYSLSLKMDVTLVNNAYEMMMHNHQYQFKGDVKVYIHSDQGKQYLATSFQELLKDNNFIQSMSARGNSYDNAPIESFFARLKNEALDIIARCNTSETAKQLIAGYINHYNHHRYQMGLAGLSPSEYYIYKTTDIYPLDNYFGVKASELVSVETLIEVQERKELARLKKIKEKRKSETKLNPLSILLKDQKTVRAEIQKWEGQEQLAKQQLKVLRKLKAEIKEAVKFYTASNIEVRKTLTNPLNWKNYQQFNYIETLNNFL